MTSSSVATAVTPEALAEDLRTAWVPDPLGHADLEPLLNRSLPPKDTLGEWERLAVPRAIGRPLIATMLRAQAHGALHRATHDVRGAIDDALTPGVCGYRRGAEVGFSYSSENRRFQQFSEGEADGSRWVVLADVERFFDHCSWDVVLSALNRTAPSASMAGVRAFADVAQRAGLATLPAGYADARLLANAVLAGPDSALDVPFARWVDDYRLFASTRTEAESSLTRLEDALAETGLTLNSSKVAIVSTEEFRAMSGMSLASVYHPDLESPPQVTAALRNVFLRAVQSDPPSRRELRFVLPRLAAQGDDIALEWVLRSVASMPWEAPRFATYLLAFQSRPIVQQFVERTVIDAADQSTWLATRFAALACHTGVTGLTADAFASAATRTRSTALWGLLLRALSLSGHEKHVGLLTGAPRDARAALAARRDVGLPDEGAADHVAEETLVALGGHPAPLPIVDSIL